MYKILVSDTILMKRCKGKTKSGNRCKKKSLEKSGYCAIHLGQAKKNPDLLSGLATGITTGLIVGGPIGVIIGAATGAIVSKLKEKEVMSRSKVFISFDYDNDVDLKNLLVGQAKNDASPFDIEDWSVKEHLTGNWKERVRSKMRRVDQVVVICGEGTNTATGVSAEIKIAQEEGGVQSCKGPNHAIGL